MTSSHIIERTCAVFTPTVVQVPNDVGPRTLKG